MTEIINGYPCRTCTDVENAKKHIDPARPQDGPFGEAAKAKAEREAARADSLRPGDPAVVLGGALAGLDGSVAANARQTPALAPPFARTIDLRA
ncbi:hypothetical protein [Zavarzinia sp. CC-PAN008]|uniref:hypothetical protein n=1 Tax=Zavarzinia sp. CC-PAN008 TaxID=3243332 RepID=UPI003F748410